MTESMLLYAKLGHNKPLSKLELSVLLDVIRAPRELEFFEFKSFLFFSLPPYLQRRLLLELPNTGSIVKIGRAALIGKIKQSLTEVKEELEEKLEKTLFTRYKKIKPPMKIAVNINSNDNEKIEDYSSFIRTTIHKIATEHNFTINLKRPKKVSFELSPAQYQREKFFKRGMELSFFKVKSKVYLGETIWITDPSKDILLDESRPVRFFTHGTSIKIARTMVFLSKIKENQLLLDPFCGTGTILILALLRNCKVIGIDIDSGCIKATKENLEAMKKKGLIPNNAQWTLHKGDVRKLSQLIKQNVNAIVTEPYLGPFLKKLPSYEKGEKIMRELEKLYKCTIAEFDKIVVKGGRIIFILPEYQYKKKETLSPDINEIIKKTSLKLITKSNYFNVKIPVKIGRKHNILSRKLVIAEKG